LKAQGLKSQLNQRPKNAHVTDPVCNRSVCHALNNGSNERVCRILSVTPTSRHMSVWAAPHNVIRTCPIEGTMLRIEGHYRSHIGI